MPTEIRWKASLSATCVHAAACRLAGLPAVDSELAAALDWPSDALAAEIAVARWPVDAVVEQLVALAASYENNRELVRRCATRLGLDLGPGDASVGRVAGAIADLEAALGRQQPSIVDELAVRGGPLREQWEARGPGMLREVQRLAEPVVVPDFADIVLVGPYAGGHGWAHVAHNRVTLEAVLVNPTPRLPEIVRLAWLLCQLNQDLPQIAEALPRSGAQSFALAMVPPVLAAGAEVELAGDDAEAIDLALNAWRLRSSAPEDAGARLWQWWNAWLDRPARSWGVAVAALEEMLR